MIRKVDKTNNFVSWFDPNTGFYKRTGVLTQFGEETSEDPFMAEFPELIDIGIMGHCLHGLSGKCRMSGVECYQHGDISHKANMSFYEYKKIIDECRHRTFQVALGGCGDPDQHEDFENILAYTRDNDIVPNYTTSGFELTQREIKLSKEYCGAVAVSWYGGDYTKRAIEGLLAEGVTTNIHYVLGNNSIDKALELLENDEKLEGINALIFLMHKPVGLGSRENILKFGDSKVEEFFNLVDKKSFKFKIGFDSCTVPGLLNYTSNIDVASIDTCEAARWSMYITPDMIALPCSFDNQAQKYGVDLRNFKTHMIERAWNSREFEKFREHFRTSCHGCPKRAICMGGCPLMPEIVLCDKTYRAI